MNLDLFVFAGETSGDVHGAAILKRLKELYPSLKIAGVAGPKMRELGLDLFMPMENFQVMGYSAVFKSIFRLIYLFKATERYILKSNPKAVLFIDFPGFNLRMAKALCKKHFPGKLIHYICPTVWAHGKNRIYTLDKTLDSLLSIFPFEHNYFKTTSIKPTYVGHPLIEHTQKNNYDPLFKERYGIARHKPLIGLFPGSRVHEIDQNLPKMLQACQLFREKNSNPIFVISVAEPKLKKLIEKQVADSKLTLNKDVFLVPSVENFNLMSSIESSLATSGTITFELAVMQVPTVVVYHLSKFNAFIARYVIRIHMPYYCIVNIICKKHIFPELYHVDFTAEKTAKALIEINKPNSYLRKNSISGCVEMLKIMGSDKSPSMLAAQEIGKQIYELQKT